MSSTSLSSMISSKICCSTYPFLYSVYYIVSVSECWGADAECRLMGDSLAMPLLTWSSCRHPPFFCPFTPALSTHSASGIKSFSVYRCDIVKERTICSGISAGWRKLILIGSSRVSSRLAVPARAPLVGLVEACDSTEWRLWCLAKGILTRLSPLSPFLFLSRTSSLSAMFYTWPSLDRSGDDENCLPLPQSFALIIFRLF